MISGHRRIEAVRRLEWDEIEVEIVETESEDEEKSLLVHYNKQRVKTCREVLNEVGILKPIYEVGQGKRSDLTFVPQNKGSKGRDGLAGSVGLSSSQLGKLLFIEKENPDYIRFIDEGKLTVSQSYIHLSRLKNEKSIEKTHQSTSTKEGPPDFTFHNKSSESMPEVGSKTVDLIFTSPPYWNKRVYGDVCLGNEKHPDQYVTNLVNHFRDCSRVIKETGSNCKHFFLSQIIIKYGLYQCLVFCAPLAPRV